MEYIGNLYNSLLLCTIWVQNNLFTLYFKGIKYNIHQTTNCLGLVSINY